MLLHEVLLEELAILEQLATKVERATSSAIFVDEGVVIDPGRSHSLFGSFNLLGERICLVVDGTVILASRDDAGRHLLQRFGYALIKPPHQKVLCRGGTAILGSVSCRTRLGLFFIERCLGLLLGFLQNFVCPRKSKVDSPGGMLPTKDIAKIFG